MTAPILYFGDTSLATAAAYLAAVMTHAGWRFDYIPSDRPAESSMLDDRLLYILSDYPCSMMKPEIQQRLIDRVEQGAGLVMLGGWESYHGLGGDWNGSIVSQALPAVIADEDDRRNCDFPVLLRPCCDHATVDGLPWSSRPPVIGGYNRFTAKESGQTIIEAQSFSARCEDGEFQFEPTGSDPLLVVGHFGQGRAAALATDVAPHWVGPLVDWGDERVSAQAPHAEAVEVGADYARLFRQILQWTAGKKLT